MKVLTDTLARELCFATNFQVLTNTVGCILFINVNLQPLLSVSSSLFTQIGTYKTYILFEGRLPNTLVQALDIHILVIL